MPKIIDEARLFDAALDLLVAHGYEGATTHKIAQIAGVNEVTIFRRFGSKAGLFEKAIENQLSDTPLNSLVFTGELESDLLAIVKAYMETNEAYGNIIPILLIEIPRNPDLEGSFRAPWNNVQAAMQILQSYQTQGRLTKESPLASLSALIGPIMVNQMFRRAGLHLPMPATNPQQHVDNYLQGRKL